MTQTQLACKEGWMSAPDGRDNYPRGTELKAAWHSRELNGYLWQEGRVVGRYHWGGPGEVSKC